MDVLTEEKQTREQATENVVEEVEEQEVVQSGEVEKVVDEKDVRIQELEEKVKELNTKALRAQADFENFQRRMKQEQQTYMKYRSQSVIEDLLPVLDNFERALSVETDNEQADSLKKGIQMVYDQLLQALQKEGLELIESVGQPFDPNVHQAVMQAQEEGVDSNIVVEELQKGYKLKERVVRPSMVKVNM